MTIELPPFRIVVDDDDQFNTGVKEMIACGRVDLLRKLEDGILVGASLGPPDTPQRRLALRRQIRQWVEQDRKNTQMDGTGGRVDFDSPPTFITYDMIQDDWKKVSISTHLSKHGGIIKVHGQSVQAFAIGSPGNAFTGVVNIFHPDGGSRAPKLFLYPVNPMGGAREYKSRPHDPNVETNLYGSKSQGALVHHDPNLDPLQAMSHIRLRSMIEDAVSRKHDLKKKEQWAGKPEDRAVHSIGFTVIKVAPRVHRYCWRSASQNNRTFQVSSEYGVIYQVDIRTPPREWAKAIVAAIDRTCLG